MRAVDDFGCCVGRAQWTGDRSLTAGVHDSDSSVDLGRVVRGDGLAILRETGFLASLLVPAAEVTAQLNRFCGLGNACVAAGLVWIAGSQQQARSQDNSAQIREHSDAILLAKVPAPHGVLWFQRDPRNTACSPSQAISSFSIMMGPPKHRAHQATPAGAVRELQ